MHELYDDDHDAALDASVETAYKVVKRTVHAPRDEHRRNLGAAGHLLHLTTIMEKMGDSQNDIETTYNRALLRGEYNQYPEMKRKIELMKTIASTTGSDSKERLSERLILLSILEGEAQSHIVKVQAREMEQTLTSLLSAWGVDAPEERSPAHSTEGPQGKSDNTEKKQA